MEEVPRAWEDAEALRLDVIPPNDSVVYFVTVLLGMGCLFPWTSIIACLDFFNNVYGKSFGAPFTFGDAVVDMYPLIAVVLLMMFFPNVVRLSVRVYTPFVVFLGVFALLPISAILFRPFFGFLVALFCTVIVGLADAVSQASLFGWAGMLPSEYVQALNLGTGVSGIFDAILRIISKVAFSGDGSTRDSVALFFSLSGVVTIMCIASFWFVSRHPFTMWYVRRTERALQSKSDPSAMSITEGTPLTHRKGLYKVSYLTVLARARNSSLISLSNNLIEFIVQKPAFFCAFTYCILFALSPGVTTHLPTHGTMSREWFTAYLILVGATGDFIGKILARFKAMYLMTAFLRMASIPLVVWCFWPPVQSNFFNFGVSFFNTFWNGYLGTRMLMIGVDMVSPDEKEAAGVIMLFALQGGLTVGSSISLVLPYIFTFSS